MYRNSDSYGGTAAGVYRTVSEIRQDMRSISERIRAANECLNLREMLLDMINEERITPESASEWIPELEDAIKEAKEAYYNLDELHDELSELREELSETRCAMGV